MKASKRIFAGLCAALLMVGGIGNHHGALAADGDYTAGGFSIKAVIPHNQIDLRKSYFDLKMKAGDTQTVQLVITNSRDEEMRANLRLNAASTGRNGLMVYTVPDVRDPLMEVSITDVASLECESVAVPPKSSVTVPIHITMPSEPVAGVLLGGLAVTGNQSSGAAPTTEGVSLQNKVTYVVALKLTEDPEPVEADFDLLSVTPRLVNFKTAVVAVLQNKAARIVKDMKVKAFVYKKQSDEVFRELTLEHAEMAPLSAGDFVIEWKNRPLEQGQYRLRMTADYEGKHWEWDEDFTIGNEADGLNKGAVGLIRDYRWLYVLLGAAVLVFVWFIAFRTGKRRRPREEE